MGFPLFNLPPRASAESDAEGPRGVRGRSLSPVTLVILVGLVSLAFSAWEFTRPGVLGLYDTGVYLGASMQLLSGHFPYEGYAFVQPPGILLLYAPAALIGRLLGTDQAVLVVRGMGALVTAANAMALAWIVRRGGRVAMSVAGFGLALAPIAVATSTSAYLEQYSVAFVLVALIVVFSGPRAALTSSTARLATAGVLVGVAGSIKVWAFFPLVALCACVVGSQAKRVWWVLLGAAGGFCAVVLPFALAAPSTFFHDVLVSQLDRASTWFDDAGVATRLVGLTGFGGTSFNLHPAGVEIVFVALLVAGAVVVAWRRPVDALVTFFYLASVLSVAGILVAPVYLLHYPVFALPFVVGFLALLVALVVTVARARLSHWLSSRWSRRLLAVVGVLALASLVVGVVASSISFYSDELRSVDGPYDEVSVLDRYIPPGSCVLYSDPGLGLLADRYGADVTRCPPVVDPEGILVAHHDEVGQPTPEVRALWESYFHEARYVVLSDELFGFVPLRGGLGGYFYERYDRVYRGQFLEIYRRR